MKLRQRIILSTISGIIFILCLVYFTIRNPLLHWRIQKSVMEINQRTGATLNIGTSRFSGFLSFSMENISFIPSKGDTLLQADSVNIRISLWKLLTGTIRIKELYSSHLNLTISCRDGICNYKIFFKERNISQSKGVRNYSIFLKRILDRAFNFAPQRANIHNVSLIYRNDTLERIFKIKEFHSDEYSLNGVAEDLQTHSTWYCNGKFSQVKKSLQVKLYSEDGSRDKLPFSYELLGLSLGFDTIQMALNGYSWSGNLLTATGTISAENLIAFHKNISDDTVKVSSSALNFSFNAGKTYLEIDSSSSASLTAIGFHPYLKYSREKGKEYSINIKTDRIASTDFFSSLPQGIFDEVRTITAEGFLQFILNFSINASQADSLVFEASLKKENFRVKTFGTANLLKMNGEFSHSVFEKDRFIRSFLVGYSNPFYTSLDSISPAFKNAVLTSEDGNFYFHNGFNEDAFRKSIITNFKAGKFVRGGSTISMQLVKNVFLSRKKTIARKAEEALLVWFIENNNLYSKERMFEVYMNIIELGPGIYGIGEASDFYFKKLPIELTLAEGIFLASLLPHPKWFKYSFDKSGNLKPYLADYYKVVSDFMLRKNLISMEEHNQLKPSIILNGPAREMIIPTDTILEEENDDTDLYY